MILHDYSPLLVVLWLAGVFIIGWLIWALVLLIIGLLKR